MLTAVKSPRPARPQATKPQRTRTIEAPTIGLAPRLEIRRGLVPVELRDLYGRLSRVSRVNRNAVAIRVGQLEVVVTKELFLGDFTGGDSLC
jgi:hypothetical protein